MRRQRVRFFERNTQPLGDRVSPSVPVTVPTDFLGMCFVAYPVSGVSPVGLLSYGSHRIGQMRETRWSTIETAPGVYSAPALAELDSIITFNRQNGVTIYFGLYGTPTFYASSAPHPTYGDDVTKGPWNALGECAFPTSLPALSAFVSMLITRYNKPGGAWYDIHGATLGKGIQYWETWNEPGHPDSNGNVTGVNQSGSGFWWGTAAQMVDVAQTQYAAIKALDQSVIVTTPGFTGSTTHSLNFLGATGNVTGVLGSQTCEAYAWHPYHHNPPGVFYANWQTDIMFGPQGIVTVKNALAASGYSYPMWISEWGVDAGGSEDAEILAWYAETPEFKYTWMSRFLMACAAYGVKSVHPWHWGENNPAYGNSGNWQLDTLGVQKAYNDLATHMVGKTIVSASFIMNGTASLSFSDGSTWAV